MRSAGYRWLVAATCSAVAWIAAGASAATFAPITLEELARRSDVVVWASVRLTETRPFGPAGLPGIHTRVELDVLATLLGPTSAELELWVQGGVVGNRMRRVEGQAVFHAGEQAVVFLRRRADGVMFPTGMARGKWSMFNRAGAVICVPGAPLRAAEPANPPPTAHGAAHSDPGAVEDAVPIDELVARVRAVRSDP